MKDLETLVHQRRGMWEDMGIDDKSALDEADEVYRRWARKRLKDGSHVCWVAQNQSGTILGGGCLWLQPIQPKPYLKKEAQPYLLSMYTEPGFRRVGVASRIVEEAIKWGKRNGYPWVSLHASDTGRDVYQKYGFKRTREMRLDLQG